MAIFPHKSSKDHDQLGNDTGPIGRTGAKKTFGWKTIAMGAAVIISIIWVFTPRELCSPMSLGTKVEENVAVYKDKWAGSSIQEVHTSIASPLPSSPPADHYDEPTLRPTSFATDPDPLKTVYCKTPYKDGLPLVQYAIIIDAGSTGSRIHIYKFNNCRASPMYEYETFKTNQPAISPFAHLFTLSGLSSFPGRPIEAAKSLDVLMDDAVRVVPESLWKCTPVAVKVTGGIRVLPGSQSADILAAVRQRLHDKYPFQLHGDNGQGVGIVEGRDAGVYAWITANYLLNTIRADTPKDTHTYAVLDLGVGLTRIIFEPMLTQSNVGLEDGEHRYDLQFGGTNRTLYQHSYMGYGLMNARKHVHRLVESDFVATFKDPVTSDVIGNPCLARGMRKVVEIMDGPNGQRHTVTMEGEDIGDFEACTRLVERVFAKDFTCEMIPCPFDGVYQPSLSDASGILLLSNFYDHLRPLLPKDTDPPRITVSSIASLAHDVCLGQAHWLKRWSAHSDVMEKLAGHPEWCLDLTFMYGLLIFGFELGDEREVTLWKQIDGTESGWCTGAAITMISGEVKCRV